MLEHLLALILVGLGLQTPALPPSVLGDQTTATETQNKKELRDLKAPLLNELKMRAGDAKNVVGERMASKAGNIEDRMKLQEEFKTKIQGVREKAKEEFQTQREAFKTRLDGIKDERKKEIIQNADTKISDINTKRTQVMTENLNKMDTIMTRISQKIEEFKAQGKDVSAAQSALTDAQTKISAAKSAVTGQAGKEYVIGITSENKLKDDVGRSIQSYQNDIKILESTMKNSRESITNVLKQIALLAGKTAEPVQTNQ